MLGDMIGAEHVDDQSKAALELLDVISDVGRAISRLAVGTGAHEHGILGESERFAAQISRAVLLERETAIAKTGEHPLDQAGFEQIEFIGENVEADAEAR